MRRRLLMAAALLTCGSPLFAQQYKDAHRLGGATAFFTPPLADAAGLKAMAERPGIAADIHSVFREAGVPGVADAFIAAVSRGTSGGIVGRCGDAAPADGVVVECDEPVGATFEWMAYRNKVHGRRVPAVLPRVRWAGKRPFAAFLVRVTVSDKRYTFIVPKPCGNVSLVSVTDDARASAAAADDRAARDAAARDQAARDQAARDQLARDQAARDQAARDQAARDQVAREQAARDQVARNETAQPPANTASPAPSPSAAVAAAPASTSDEKPSTPFFADVLVGGERRNRPADPVEGKPTDFTQGSGFVGLKIGAAKKFDSNWEVAGAVGVGGMFLFKHDTVNEWPWFGEVEVNRYFGRWFVGTGLSIWDFTRSNLWTPSGDLRFGIPLGHHPKHPIYFIGEGRWYLDHRTHLETHRQMWGGLRIHL